jgi:hypothetical protein
MSPLRILVLGYIVRCPLGGMAWHYLQYVLGLADLGHDVYYLEDSDGYPSCYDPSRHLMDVDPTYGLRFTHGVFRRVGLGERWAYYDAHRDRWLGPRGGDAIRLCSQADLLVNVSGTNPLRPWTENVPARAFIDTDPVFEQIRQLTVPARAARARAHTAHFTFGHGLVDGSSPAPDAGLAWQATRQPVVLRAWPARPPNPTAPFTSVLQWDSYEKREHAGIVYRMKAESIEALIDLPRRTGPLYELALGSPNAPRDRLREHGWKLRNPLPVSRTPWSYQRYIRDSKAELSIAKHGYVAGRSGWFSERSAVYLASGRPVVAQDTGFSSWLPTGRGLLAFDDVDQAAAAVEDVVADYDRHCRDARALAVEHFDSRKVLADLVERAVATPARVR